MSRDRENTVTETYFIGGQPYGDEMAPFWDPEDKRQETIHYLLYEEDVLVEIDLDTGQSRILRFAGKDLASPTDWR